MSITRPPIIEFVVDNEVIKVFLFNVCNKYIKDTLVIKKILRNYLYPPPQILYINYFSSSHFYDGIGNTINKAII